MFKIKPQGTKICPVCGQNKLNENEYAFLNGNGPFNNGHFIPKRKTTKVNVINTSPGILRQNKKIVSLF